MEKFLQGFKIVSNSESADLDAEGNGTQHVPVVKRLSWAVRIFEAQIGSKVHLATEQLLKRTDPQGSAGLMPAQHAASPSAYFVPSAMQYKDLKLPGGAVQCDVQGSIQVGSCCMLYIIM